MKLDLHYQDRKSSRTSGSKKSWFFWRLGVRVLPLFFFMGCSPAVLIVPSYIQNVGVQVFQNKTSEFGLDTLFTEQTIRQFQIDGRMPLEDPSKADMVVKVVVTQYIEEPQLYDPKTNAVLQYRISIVYDLAAVDQKENRTFAEDKDKIHSVFYYSPLYVGAATETKQQAQEQLAEDLGRSIVRRVLEGY